MPDTTEVKWIHPVNWDGNRPEVGSLTPGWRKVIVQLTGLSDGTGESNVQKVNISELRTAEGEEVTRTSIEKIEYQVSGLNVLLEWDRTPHAVITRLLGANGTVQGVDKHPKVDPSDGTDGTGDILLTTTGATSGDGYNITLHILLKS